MLKQIVLNIIVFATYNFHLQAISEREINFIAQQLKTSAHDIKTAIPAWKNIQSVQNFVQMYKKIKLKNTIDEFIPLQDILKKNSNISYLKLGDSHHFSYKPFPLSKYPLYQPEQGTFAETFILKIPNGKVFSRIGFVQTGSHIIKDLLSQNYPLEIFATWKLQCSIGHISPQKIPGRVLVLTRNDHDCYGHWLAEFLPRLLMVHEQHIAYDWIYVPYTHRYIKESLALLGVHPSKIIEPMNKTFYVQADELIVPSLTARQIPSNDTDHFTGYYPATFYCPNWAITMLQNTFLPMIESVDTAHFSKRIFISRKDAGQRKMINEDEVFALFEQKGFKRYNMSELTFLQQIALFHNAEYVVGAHGSGLTNLIFCKPGTIVFEIFQNQFDNGFWQLSDQLGLHHTCINTQELQPGSWKVDTKVPIHIIKNYCDTIPNA